MVESPAAKCLDDETVLALLDRELSAASLAVVDRHLDECHACRAMVAALVDEPDGGEDATQIDAPSREPELPKDPRLGQVLEGKWTLEERLGEGGMASVYRARHRIGEVAAIKILHPSYAQDAEVRARFQREARAVHAFRHRSAVEVRDDGVTDDGSPFLVMEYLEGRPLNLASLSFDALLVVIDEVLDVLAAAHEAGIVHRDIKPANILVLDDGAVKVVDFGVVHARGPEGWAPLTVAGQTVGTLAYMPPEQLAGQTIDGRADLYSVGATMFSLLAGRRVHVGTTRADTLRRIAQEPAPSLGAVAPGVPEPVAALVDRALAFRPEDRFPTARAMQEAVRALLGDAIERIGTRVGERYVLGRLIARGGMGVVYEAQDDESGERCAIKIASTAQTDATTRARFLREADASSRIRHRNVVRVFDAGAYEDGLFCAMELVRGHDLAQRLATGPRPDPEQLRQIFVQACHGVEAAHREGVIHRDLKPANLILDGEGDDLVVKICDFGLAKTNWDAQGQASTLTQTGAMLGTPQYTSPEQATQAADADERSDVWGLCISLYEALRGERPWAQHETLGQLIVAICTTDIEPLPESVEAGLRRAVMKGLARDPDDRWQSVAELRGALEGTYVAPSPPAPSRGRWVLAGGALLAGAALALVVLGLPATPAPEPSPEPEPIPTAAAETEPTPSAAVPSASVETSIEASTAAPATPPTAAPKAAIPAKPKLPPPPVAPKPKPTPKPGGLDFQKKW